MIYSVHSDMCYMLNKNELSKRNRSFNKTTVVIAMRNPLKGHKLTQFPQHKLKFGDTK